MSTRRAFLMTSLTVGAACSVLMVTTRIGKAPTADSRVLLPNAPAPSPTLEASKTPGSSTAPLVLIPRGDWGAAAPAVTPDGQGEYGPYNAVTNPDGWLVYDQPLESVYLRVIIHHSALPLTDGPREIQRLHMEEKGFADIGYQFLIGREGQLYEGRALNVRGAHTYGANYGSLGICLLGNFEEIQPAPLQLTVLKTFLGDMLTRYPLLASLAGHRDYNPGLTLCPGAALYALLPELAKGLNLEYRI